jgi:hypothetical protein
MTQYGAAGGYAYDVMAMRIVHHHIIKMTAV